MRAYVHCCIAVHPYFTGKPQHVTLTNRIPGLGSQHTACMCVWNQTPTVCTPSSAHRSTLAVWCQTINDFSSMSSAEVKVLCLEPDRQIVCCALHCLQRHLLFSGKCQNHIG